MWIKVADLEDVWGYVDVSKATDIFLEKEEDGYKITLGYPWWETNEEGKTVQKCEEYLLTEEEAKILGEWIENERKKGGVRGKSL